MDRCQGEHAAEEEDWWEGDGDDPQRAKSADELRKEWNEAVDAVHDLERKGGPRLLDAIIADARRHRDAAERAWRAAKAPHPLGKRLRWAATALEAAMAKEHAHQAEWDAFEEATARRRAELAARQQADVARTAKKQQELDDLRCEAGPTGEKEAEGTRAMDEIQHVRPTLWATRVAHEGIQCSVGPAIERVLQQLQEGSPAWLELQGALSSVTNVFGVLDEAVRDKGGLRTFDISEGDGGDAGEDMVDSIDGISLPTDDDVRPGDGQGRQHAGGDGGEADPKRRAVEGRGGGVARWTKPKESGEGAWTRAGVASGSGATAVADGTSGQHPLGGGPAARQGEQGGSRDSAAAAAAEQRRNVEEAERRRAAEQAAERLRLEQALTPEQRAQAANLHAQQAAAASAGFGSEQALQIAQQVHSQRLDEVVKAARERDLHVDLAELRAYSAEELEDWARRHV